MKKRWVGMMIALTGGLLAGTAQAVVIEGNLNLAPEGNYTNATVVSTPFTYNGATFDVNYTLGSIATGSNSFVNSSGAVMGVGFADDLPTHYSTLEGNDGEGMSFAALSISNFNANGSGLALEDFSDLQFVNFSVGASGHNPDGVTMSFTSFTDDTFSMSLTGLGLSYTVDLTDKPNYPVFPNLATNLFIKPSSAGASNRWNVEGIGVSYRLDTGNEIPVADAQSIQILPDTAVEITLTGSDFEGSNLTYTVVDFPLHGDLVGATNVWTYTPTSGYEGTDLFTFTVNDGAEVSDLAEVSIMITNDLPVATEQSVNTFRDASVDITLSGTDTDGPSNLTYSVVSGPGYGVLSGVEPNLVYTPTSGFVGEDFFTFNAFDGLASGSAATVTVTVVNNPPVADPKIVLTQPDTPVAITLSGSDAEGNFLTYSVVTQPANGSLTGTEPNLIYTPTNGFSGVDSFTYTVNDAQDDSAPATVTISVSTDGINLSFSDLNPSTTDNTLNVGGVPATVTGVFTNLDYVYSVSFEGLDLDGDLVNDELTFDVRVKAWTNGVTDLGMDVLGSSNIASATIGTSNVAVNVANNLFTVEGNTMPDGSSLEFSIENMAVTLTDANKTGDAEFGGFTGVLLEEINNGNSHHTIFGEGTDLLGYMWSIPDQFPVSDIDVGTGALYVSSSATTNSPVTRPFNWGVNNVDFGITITLGSSAIPPVAIDVSGSDLVFSWEGGATYDVLTNANLVYPSWGVAIPGAVSPVTNAVTDDPVLFFKLSE
ncbi:Ig-like domain-containing protein [Pontiellaceae bacterium B12219]|nr:Ig-like domain-containing protein [Pontiellaceae bacterium B12219]